uniref:Ion_trans_2 domain-containing protein n=1 Tax=Meloidogyne hapla TaxID=6305 RepID=A0A1I8BKE4_MELHA
MTLFTTIGYGTIACQTALGKFSVWHTNDVNGPWRCWTINTYISHVLPQECQGILSQNEELENEDVEVEEEEFPLSLLLPIVAFYILLVSSIVSLLDWSKDGKLLIGGLGFGDAFLSLATIGLGDVMPYNLQYTPLLAVLFLAGLALLSLVNSTIYVRLQNRFLAIMDCLEDFLERVQYNNKKSLEGYSTFVFLSPSIKFLATALPLNFLEDEKQQNNNNIKNKNHKRCRSKSMNAVGDKKLKEYQQKENHYHQISSTNIANFRPTLGVMTAATSPRPSRQPTFNMGTSEINNNKRRRISKDGGMFLNKTPIGEKF